MGKFPLIIKDSSGESVFFAASCWIDSIPEVSYGTDVTEREWSITAPNGSMYVGGNYRQSGMMEDVIGVLLGAGR